MSTTLARKFFARTVSITGGAAVSLGDIMRAAPAVTGSPAWGTNTDGTPSADTFEGNMCTITPAAGVVYFGYSAQVADADTASTYKGASITIVGEPFEVAAYCRGIIDAEHIFLYSPSTQDLTIIFVGF
jgi:hypothetical protein